MSSIKRLISSLVHAVVIVSLIGLSLPHGLSWGEAGHYYNHILVKGKLQRFNDNTRVIYYSLDRLDNLPGWDYTQWNFLKDQVVADAFSDWEQALHGQVNFRYTTDPRLTDIAVHWRTGFDNEAILGMERPNTIAGTYLANADIEITLSRQGKPLSREELKAVALHEIGHALGMNGHSPYPGDIMYPSVQAKVNRLSSRDVQTMRMIYNNKPHITNPPGIHLAAFRAALDSFSKGYAAYRAKQYDKAYQLLSTASKLYPQEMGYQYMTGLAAMAGKQYPQARPYFEKVAATPNDNQANAQYYLAELMIQQAQAALQKGQKAQALKSYQQCATLLTTLMNNPKASSEVKKSAKARKDEVAAKMGQMV